MSAFAVAAILSGFEAENVAVGLAAARRGAEEVALGTVVGGAIFLVCVALGLSALLVGMVITPAAIEVEEVIRQAIPAREERPEISAGNLVGTLLYFLWFNLGLISVLVPVRVSVVVPVRVIGDRVFITIRHADGTLSSVAYLAGGDRAMPAERIEVSGGGKSAVLDHWRELTVWSGGSRKRLRFKAGKGHEELLSAFVVSCVSGGEWPVPWEDLRATSLAAVLAAQSAREGIAFELESP